MGACRWDLRRKKGTYVQLAEYQLYPSLGKMVKSNLGVMISAGGRGVGGNLNNKADRGRGRGRWGCLARAAVAWTAGCALDDGRGISRSMGNVGVAAMNKHLPSKGAW